MCGICGLLYFDGRPVEKYRLQSMTDALLHRGPDDEGIAINGAGVGLGFRRLSIIDVSGGHQPMTLGKTTIVLNGEIYNYRELKRECESRGRTFKTRSDTEVLLHLYEEFGEGCLAKLNGMFAFAIWNSANRTLFLARDRLGIKPLYYYHDRKKFAFASEIRSLYLSGEVPLEFDPTGIRDYFAYRFVPGPHSVLKGVMKVLPGHSIRISDGQLTDQCYWSLESDGSAPSSRSFSDLKEELLALLEDAVRTQMVSDVPLGAFLSGGLDSSLVTALMARNSSSRIRTFSIGFEKGSGVDESAHARKVARLLDTEHHELILNEKDLARSESIFSRMNEPVADPTILPTAILSQFARESVKVVLTGEGGDELFAGYNRYKSVIYSEWVRSMPGMIRPLAGALLRRSGNGACFRAIPDVTADNWFELNRDFSRETLDSLFRNGGASAGKSYFTENNLYRSKDILNDILHLETRTALVDRLLMKVDMASMAHSLEARPPYLDHRVVRFAHRLPSKWKVRLFKGKYILRSAAARFLPREICWRKKHGFIVPIWKWVRAQPEGWLDSALAHPVLESSGLFDMRNVQNKVQKIYNGSNDVEIAPLWPMIVLSKWLESLRNDRKKTAAVSGESYR